MTRTLSRKRRVTDPAAVGLWSSAGSARTALPARTCGLAAPTGAETEEDDRGPGRDAQPRNGAATIVCNGSGGYRVALNSWAGAPCGIEGCVRRHEASHAADWLRRWPQGCKDKADGAQIPLGGPGYDAFLRTSECTAYGVEERCIAPLLTAATRGHTPCEARLRTHLADTRAQKASFC